MVAGGSMVLIVWPVEAFNSPVVRGLMTLCLMLMLMLSPVLEGRGWVYITEPRLVPHQYTLVGTHARDGQPPVLLIRVVVVVVVVIVAVPVVVRWDMRISRK